MTVMVMAGITSPHLNTLTSAVMGTSLNDEQDLTHQSGTSSSSCSPPSSGMKRNRMSSFSSMNLRGTAATSMVKRVRRASSPPGRQDTRYTCPHPDCSYSTTKRYRLKRHQRIHSGEKPHACPVKGCDYRSCEKGNLVTHMRVHTGEKPYKCPYEGCSYKCSQKGSLKNHYRIHTGEKPFACPILGCGYRSSRKSHISRHMKTHEARELNVITGYHPSLTTMSIHSAQQQQSPSRKSISNIHAAVMMQPPQATPAPSSQITALSSPFTTASTRSFGFPGSSMTSLPSQNVSSNTSTAPTTGVGNAGSGVVATGGVIHGILI